MNQFPENLTHKKAVIIGLILTALTTYAAYYGIVDHQFLQWDDTLYIHKNPHLEPLNFENIYWMFTNYELGNWHPVTWLSLALNLSLSGYNPISFKLVNITIHIFNSVMVYLLIVEILQAVRFNLQNNRSIAFSRVTDYELSIASFVSALLFALHPQHVESVTWISERKDVLCSLFFLATMYSYIKYRRTDNRKWLTSSILFYFLALMSKPMAVTLPLVLILIDLYPLNIVSNFTTYKDKIINLIKDKISFFVLAIIVSLITIITQRHGIQGSDYLTLDSRIINACMSIILYIYKFLWPVNLSPFYPYHPWSTDPNIFSLIPIVTMLTVFAALTFLSIRKKIHFPIVAFIYIVITLLPVIGLVKVGSQAAADRYTYLPLLSLYIILAGGGSILFHMFRHSIAKKLFLLSAALLISIAFFTLTSNLNKAWKNDETLWHTAIELYPGHASSAYNNLASYYFNIGDLSKAKIAFTKTLALEPENIGAFKKLGMIYNKMGNEELALYNFREITRIYPASPVGYTLLGDHYYGRRKLREAKTYYEKAFQLAPSSTVTLQRKALIDLLNNDLNSAKHIINHLVKLAPNDIGAIQLAAKIYLQDNDIERARQFANKILSLNPNDSFAIDILNNIESRNNL